MLDGKEGIDRELMMILCMLEEFRRPISRYCCEEGGI